VQSRLWEAAEAFFATRTFLQIEFANVLREPEHEIERLVEFLDLQPHPSQRKAAAAAIWRATSADAVETSPLNLGTQCTYRPR
jgi:hypothetical protein